MFHTRFFRQLATRTLSATHIWIPIPEAVESKWTLPLQLPPMRTALHISTYLYISLPSHVCFMMYYYYCSCGSDDAAAVVILLGVVVAATSRYRYSYMLALVESQCSFVHEYEAAKPVRCPFYY